MLKFSRSSLIALSLLVFGIPSAKAEVFHWQDPVSKVSVTVPDTWRMAHDQKPGDVMTFWAPGVNDHASCKMQVHSDKRFVIYPQRYFDEIQRINFGYDFWDKYSAQYDNVNVHQVKNSASLGRGFASYVDMSFVTTSGPKVSKRGIALVSNYNDRDYVLECSAEEHSFDKWYGAFLSVAKSVDFRKIIHEFPAGNYRSFLGDQVVIQNEKDVDLYFY